MNLPNKLTIFRIILVPIMVIIPIIMQKIGIEKEILGISIQWIIVDILFIIASITDKLDGDIARKNNQVTTFGKFLDPIADKILVLAAMIILVENQRIPAWIPIIILFREFVVSGYRLIAVEIGGKVIAASIWGKMKTVTQMCAIILAFVDKFGFGTFIHSESVNMTTPQYVLNVVVTILMILSVIATIFSGWEYIKNGKELLKDK